MPEERHEEVIAICAVSRSAAFMRGVLWVASSTLCGIATVVVFQTLDFSPAGASHRLVDVSIAIVTLPVAACGLYLAVLGLRWIGLAAWPGSVGIIATNDELSLLLGPFGTKRFDTAQLDLKYAFELSADEDEGGFESFLPEEEQMAKFLPRMLHPSTKDRIDPMLLKFAQRPEAEVARSLRPAFDKWRSKTS